MAITFKHIQRIASAAANYGSLLQVGDRLDVVFRKLQGLLVWKNTYNSLISTFSGGASSTADINIMTLDIDPTTLFSGATYRVTINGTISKPLSLGTTLNVWLKIGTDKTAILTFTPTATRTDTAFNVEFLINVRTVGAAGTMYASGVGIWEQTDTSALTALGDGPLVTLNNTVSFPLTVGFNFSNSNASNNLTAQTGIVLQL